MSELSEIAYQIDPALWVRKVLGVEPAPWQEQFLRAPRGASILALTARQAGKTTAATWAIAHYMLFTPGSLSVIACPAQRQSGEAVRRVREILLKIGVELKSDHVYGLELKNGSRVLALPGSEDSIRGLTVDGLIVADEAARLPEAIFASLRPMRARRRLGQMMIRHGLYRSISFDCGRRRRQSVRATLTRNSRTSKSCRRVCLEAPGRVRWRRFTDVTIRMG